MQLHAELEDFTERLFVIYGFQPIAFEQFNLVYIIE